MWQSAARQRGGVSSLFNHKRAKWMHLNVSIMCLLKCTNVAFIWKQARRISCAITADPQPGLLLTVLDIISLTKWTELGKLRTVYCTPRPGSTQNKWEVFQFKKSSLQQQVTLYVYIYSSNTKSSMSKHSVTVGGKNSLLTGRSLQQSQEARRDTLGRRARD